MALLASRVVMLTRRRVSGNSFTSTCMQCRGYTSAPPPSPLSAPPLLLKLRSDLKAAMKAKDTSRLNVLRALLADVTNSAKTSSPVNTDMQLLSLLRKRVAAAQTATAEFKSAGRQDLVDNEEEQASILQEYAGSVKTMPADDVRAAVLKVVDQVRAVAGAKVNAGVVLKKLLAPGGSLDGKPVEKSAVAKAVKEMLDQP